MRIASFDTSRPGYIIVSLLPVDGSVEEYAEYMDTLIRTIREVKQRSVLIFDGTHGVYIDKDRRAVVANYLRKHKELYMEKILGTATVTPSIISRVVTKTLMLLIEKEMRPVVFSSMANAISWANEALLLQKKPTTNFNSVLI